MIWGMVNSDHMSTRVDDGVLNMAGGTAAMMIADEWTLQDVMNQNPDANMGSFVIPFNLVINIPIAALSP